MTRAMRGHSGVGVFGRSLVADGRYSHQSVHHATRVISLVAYPKRQLPQHYDTSDPRQDRPSAASDW